MGRSEGKKVGMPFTHKGGSASFYMTRQKLLSAPSVNSKHKAPGYYLDGHGLYLQVALGASARARKVEHHSSCPYAEVPDLYCATPVDRAPTALTAPHLKYQRQGLSPRSILRLRRMSTNLTTPRPLNRLWYRCGRRTQPCLLETPWKSACEYWMAVRVRARITRSS